MKGPFFPVPRPLYACTSVRCPGPLGSCSPMCSLGALRSVCDVLGHLAPVYRCAPSVCCVACAVSWASWLLYTGVLAQFVVLHVRCPGPLGSCSTVCLLGVLRSMCGVLGHLALFHRCAHSVCCVACSVSWATWPLSTGVPAQCSALLVRCPGQLCSCSPVCPLGALHVVCSVSWATWLLFSGVLARCVVLRVRLPGRPGSVHRSACLVRCVVCSVSLDTWLLFTGVLAWCVVLRVRCPRPLGSCSWVCRSVYCVVRAVSWAT